MAHSAPPVLQVEHLSKRYTLGRPSARTLRDAFGAFMGRAGAVARPAPPPFWALDDVSFSVQQGQVVGLIGRNGAGKSTLLRIISGIAEPTRGSVSLDGRVGSLLEVGTGFHPDLTGRDNVFLNGALLGIAASDLRKRFDDIVAFAEIEAFLDTPVKHYSSGMYMRLAFAVAAHLEPEILLVDEVLAVGDLPFQEKCLGKMGEMATSGRTVLFVSHNLTAVQQLCSRALWLDAGKILEDGPATEVSAHYLSHMTRAEQEGEWPDWAHAPGNDAVRIRAVRVRSAGGELPLTIRTPLELEFDYWNLQPGARLNLSVHLLTREGITVFNTGPISEPHWNGRPFPVGLFRSVCRIPGDLLNAGLYRVRLMVVRDQAHALIDLDSVVAFEVHDSPEMRGAWHGPWPGVIRPDLPWTTELLSPGAPRP